MKHVKVKPVDVQVDHRVQRDLDVRRVGAMASAFDPNLMGVPVCSLRSDGSHWCADGQHRIAASVAAGYGNVPILMEVHEGLSLPQEARLFLRLNGGRTSVRALDKYGIRLEAEEPLALEIQTTLKKFGCKVTRSPQRYGVMAIASVERAHHKGNLSQTLRTLVAWLDGDPGAFDGMLFDAVSSFFVAVPDADPEHLAKRLESLAPEKLRALLRRETQHAANSRPEAAKFVLTDIYNRKTAKARRVSWHTDTSAAAE